MTVSVDAERRARLLESIEDALRRGSRRDTSLTRREFEKLRGRLIHVAGVVWGGRTFTSGLHAQRLPSGADEALRLDPAAKADLVWWQGGLPLFNGKAKILGSDMRPTVWLSADV